MGNAGSSSTNNHRQKSSDLSTPNSPFRDINAMHGAGASQTYDAWDKKDTRSVLHGSSQEDDDDTNSPYYTCRGGIGVNNEYNSVVGTRKRASTVSETGVSNSSRLSYSKDIVNKSISNISCNDKAESKEDVEEENMSDQQEAKLLQSEDNKHAGLPTVLRWDGGGKNVMISGTFSKWKPIPMVRSHGNFVTIIDLPEGDHQYKFCVDGEWKHDPKVKCIENDDGEKNNMVSVRQSDFEVFQALAKDSEANATQPEKEYTQEVPQVKPWEKVSGPPVLPPHLLQVILNKDTPLSCEPTLLPEPNHVMLNHLYALSIKDGVMVLSATHRYRKKYVTTLLYKPI